MAFAIVDVAKQMSNDVFTGKMKGGVVSQLTSTLPEVQIGDTEFFDLSARTLGEIVGEGKEKSPTAVTNALRHIRTVKIHYTERLSDEFLVYDEAKQLGIVEKLAQKWMLSDFLRDLDTVIIHGVNPHSGEVAETIQDYITKKGSSVLVPSTGDTADAIDTDLATAISSVSDTVNIDGVAFSNTAAAKLAGKMENGAQKYPSLGRFGLNVQGFEGLKGASSQEVGQFGETKLIVGDWSALKWGVAAEMPVELIKFGDPDGLGDLKRYNQVALRYEVIFGFGIANPKAFAVVKKAEEAEAEDSEEEEAEVEA